MPLAPGIQTVGMALRATLRAARRPAEILDLTQAGLVPLYADALLDDALSTGVALVAVEVNLRLFLDPLARPGWESMPGLVRRLKFGKALRVCQALENQGMTVFDPPLLRLREQLGLLHVFEGARQGALDQLTAIGAGDQRARPAAPEFSTACRARAAQGADVRGRLRKPPDDECAAGSGQRSARCRRAGRPYPRDDAVVRSLHASRERLRRRSHRPI